MSVKTDRKLRVVMDSGKIHKWTVYELLKKFAGKVLKISQSTSPLWVQHEQIAKECETIADEICGDGDYVKGGNNE